jgi:hypothetical protein
MECLYCLIGVAPGDSAATIRSAYLQVFLLAFSPLHVANSRSCHFSTTLISMQMLAGKSRRPSSRRYPPEPPFTRVLSDLSQIATAYHVLRDEKTKREYDRKRGCEYLVT